MDSEALRQSLITKFRDSTSDRLERIGLALLALEKDAFAATPAEDIARELHTMKGEASMLGLPRINELAHACEDLLRCACEGRASFSTTTDLLLQACDLIQAMLEDLASAQRSHEGVQGLCESLNQAVFGAANGQPDQNRELAGFTKLVIPKPDSPPAPAAKNPTRSIRVSVDVLDRLGVAAGDLLVEGARASLRSTNLSALAQQFNRISDRFSVLAERAVAWMPEEAGEITRLEADFSLLRDDAYHLVRSSADGINVLNNCLNRLAEQVAEARLVPLSTVFAAFPRAVRDIAKQQGKEVELVLNNAEVGVDRGMLGEVRDAMVHLLRNAVDHGIEQPGVREAVKKPRTGHITITVVAEGGMLAVTVEDDGCGMDHVRLRETAVSRGLLSQAQAAMLSEREGLELVFLPGFSTRDAVTDLSGRGVGMTVVKQKIEALGGSVSIQTELGQRTRIGLRLPQSTALIRVLLVRLGNDVYAVPAVDVQSVGRVHARQQSGTDHRMTVEFRGQQVALVDLAALFCLASGPRNDAPLAIFVKHGDDQAAFLVDGFVGEREVAVKPCGGEFLKGVSCVTGAAALEDGRVAVLLHVPDILLEIRRRSMHGSGSLEKNEKPWRVLLVEDSSIARAAESALIRSLGHTVEEAVDGQDALDKLALGNYDLVIADIQMPRIDGIELTRRIKSNNQTASIPVVVISSLDADEDKNLGFEAGANAYLEKGKLSVEALAQTLAQLSNYN